MVFTCRQCQCKRTWSSSGVFASHYLVNQKYVSLILLIVSTLYYLYRLLHSFTCAGMLPVQYSKFSQFAELGVLGTSYISRSMLLLSYYSGSDLITNICIFQYIGRVATSGWCRKWQISPCKKPWMRCALSQSILLKERWVYSVFYSSHYHMHNHSGLWLMPGTIQHQMHTILLLLVFLEGTVTFVLCIHIQSVYTTAPLKLWGYAQSLKNSVPLPRHEILSALKLCCRRSFSEVLNWVFSCTLSNHIYAIAGLNVVEVAHDIQLSVSKYISDSLFLINSFDTWHGELLYMYKFSNCYRHKKCSQANEEEYCSKGQRLWCYMVSSTSW